MLFVFPRLDRPSVVGDDGRPRTASLTAASLVVVGLMLAAGFATGSAGTIQTAGFVSGLTVAGLVLLDRDRFAQQFVGAFISIPVGSALILWLLYTAAASIGIMAGLSLAMFGLALAWTDMGDRDGIGAIVENASVSYGGIILGMIAPLAGVVGYWFLRVLADSAVSSVLGVGIFLFSLGVLALSLYLGCRWLPIVQLTPRPKRDAMRARFAWIRKALLVTVAVSFVLLVPTMLFLSFVPLGIGALLGSPVVLVPMLVVSSIVFVAGFVVVVVERIIQGTNEDVQRLIAAMCVGALIGVFVFVVPSSGGFVTIALGLVLLGPLLFIVGAVAVIIAMGIGIFPEEGGGLALASVGLVVTTLGAGVAGAPAPFVFAAAAATVVVWDLSTFGMGLTADLGHVPETRRLEILHAVGVVALATVAVLVASGLYTLQQSLQTTATGAMVLVGIGGLLVVFTLRG